MDTSFSRICDHTRLKRINDDFVRCLECGQSFVNQLYLPMNKKLNDFTRESNIQFKNFDRNFTNTIDEVDEFNSKPINHYYTDKHRINKIIVNWNNQFNSDPPKYQITVNGDKSYLTKNEIKKILRDLRAIRVK